MTVAAQQIKGNAMPLRRQHQAPCRGEIERPGIVGEFADDEGKRAASYTLFHRPECIGGVTRLDMEHAGAAGHWKAMEIGAATSPDTGCILHPEPMICALSIPALLLCEGERHCFAGCLIVA